MLFYRFFNIMTFFESGHRLHLEYRYGSAEIVIVFSAYASAISNEENFPLSDHSNWSTRDKETALSSNR